MMDVSLGFMIAGFSVALAGNILVIGMAWGSLRARLNHIGKEVDKIDGLVTSQVGMKKDIGSAFRQIDELKKQASN